MSRIVKAPEEEQKIRPYDFFTGFTKPAAEIRDNEEPESEEEAEEDAEGARELEERASREEILEKARNQARDILADAREQAEVLREQAYNEGKEQGREAGFQEAYDEQRRILEQEILDLQKNITEVVQSISIEKEKIIERSVDSLKDVSLSVAEKIIKTSIQSSGDIVKRMILAATDKMKKRQWAKIYVTKCSAAVSLEVDTEFLEALAHLSDNIKIAAIDDGEEGTCIIELPDEIIDASVSTQLENIKDIINNARV